MNELKSALDSAMGDLHFDEAAFYRRCTTQKKHRPYRIGVLALAAALVATLGTAGAASVYHSMGSTIGNTALDDDGYTTFVAQSVTDQGITVTLNDVLISNEQLVCNLDLVPEDGTSCDLDLEDYTLSVDGQTISHNGHATGTRLSADTEEADDSGIVNNWIWETGIGTLSSGEHAFVLQVDSVYRYEAPLIDLSPTVEDPDPDDNEAPAVSTESPAPVAGNWTFTFTADSSALALDTTVTPINQTIPYMDGTLTLKELRINTYETVIYADYSGDPDTLGERDDDPYSLDLAARDSNGQESVFSSWEGLVSDSCNLVFRLDGDSPLSSDPTWIEICQASNESGHWDEWTDETPSVRIDLD